MVPVGEETGEKEKRRNTDAAWQPLNFARSREREGETERGREKKKKIYTSPTRAAPRAGEEDLNFKFYLIIFEFNFVTCPEGGSRPRQQSWRYSRAYIRAHRYITHACAHCIGIHLVAERAVGGFFLLHPAKEDVRDLRSGCSLYEPGKGG